MDHEKIKKIMLNDNYYVSIFKIIKNISKVLGIVFYYKLNIYKYYVSS
jgi:hypothetical protein